MIAVASVAACSALPGERVPAAFRPCPIALCLCAAALCCRWKALALALLLAVAVGATTEGLLHGLAAPLVAGYLFVALLGALMIVLRSQLDRERLRRDSEQALGDRRLRDAGEVSERLRSDLADLRVSVGQQVEERLEQGRRGLVRQARIAAIGQLAASIAHDLRNPLGVIRNAVFLMRRRLARLELPQDDVLNIIEDEIRASDAIITNLVDVTRNRPPECEEVEFEALLREVTSRLDSTGRVGWTISTANSPHWLWADAQQLRQVLEKLLRNAVEASKGSGPVQITGWATDEMDFIDIRDEGAGIAPEIRGMLFEPLVTTKRTGAGMGLMFCRQVIERHGGSIEYVESNEKGATFRIALPRGSRECQVQPGETANAAPA